MKEGYIKSKVVQLAGPFFKSKRRTAEMERAREIARVGNLITSEIDRIIEKAKYDANRIYDKAKRDVATITHHILNDELK